MFHRTRVFYKHEILRTDWRDCNKNQIICNVVLYKPNIFLRRSYENAPGSLNRNNWQ